MPEAQPDGPPLPVVKYPLGAITALTFDPGGKRLAVGTYGQVVLFDTATWQPGSVFRQVEDSVRALAFHPEGKILAVGSGLPSRDGRITFWDTTGATPPRTYPSQRDTIEALAFRKDGKGLLLGADDNKARYYPDLPLDYGAVLDEHNGRVQAVAFSPKDDFVFVTGAMDKIVKVWDMKTRHSVVNFDQSESGITGLAFLPNGVQFVGSSLDGKLYWWGVNYDERKQAYSGYLFRAMMAHPGGVYTLALSADGKRLITGGEDHNVCVWNTDGGQIRTFKEATQPIYAVALSPDGKIAAGGGRDGMVRIWDVDANKLVAILVPPALPIPAAPVAPKIASKKPVHKQDVKRHK